jgi:ribosomal protein L9
MGERNLLQLHVQDGHTKNLYTQQQFVCSKKGEVQQQQQQQQQEEEEEEEEEQHKEEDKDLGPSSLNRKRTLSRISNLLLNYTIQDLLFMLLLN